jgi:hypothetical protein
MWRWGGLVAVLTDQVSQHARLTGLDAVTGAVRWVLQLPGSGLLGSQAATGDGGLATLGSDGVLRVVNLADGRIRWARFAGRWPALAAAGGRVMFGMGGRLTGYDARTGQVRWRLSGLPGQTQVQVLAGLALVTSNGTGRYTRTTLVAVDPATGRVAWRFDPRSAAIALDTVPLVTASSVVAVEGGVVGYPAVRLVSRDAATGKQLWAHALVTTPARPPAGAAPGGPGHCADRPSSRPPGGPAAGLPPGHWRAGLARQHAHLRPGTASPHSRRAAYPARRPRLRVRRDRISSGFSATTCVSPSSNRPELSSDRAAARAADSITKPKSATMKPATACWNASSDATPGTLSAWH